MRWLGFLKRRSKKVSELGSCRVCGGDAAVTYPLLPTSPAFCSEHHNAKDAGPFGCDFSGPDDFDIPVDGPYEIEPVWIDKEGNSYYSEGELKDDHLVNIVKFLRVRVQESRGGGREVRAFALEAKRVEMERYAKQRGLEV